jgi:hypothetical protein
MWGLTKGEREMILSDKVYDVLKWVALIALPATGTLYNTLSSIWGIPFGGEVLATCTAVALFIGVLIGVSQHNINRSNGVKKDELIDDEKTSE